MRDFERVVPFRLNVLKRGEVNISEAQEFAFESDFVPVADTAHIKGLEIADGFCLRHPKGVVLITLLEVFLSNYLL